MSVPDNALVINELLLAGARVVTPDGVLGPGWIRVADGRIADVGPGSPAAAAGDVVDLTDRWVLPGFVDIHVHGGGGASFTEGGAAEARQAAAFHRAHGSTRIVASLVTAPLDELEQRAGMLADLVDEGVIDGIHLEGPFLSHARCGAQDPRYLIDPDVAAFKRLISAGRGHVRQITIAPELPCAADLIHAAVEAGVVAAAGHSDATAQATDAAIGAGVTHATHLFNGSRPLDHREPGPPGALLDRQVTCEVIADGMHLHDMTIRLVWRAAGSGQLVLVTDAMAAAGMPDGRYRLGPQEVVVNGGVARLAEGLPGAGSIAGSTATMAQCVRRALRNVRLPVLDVAAAASTTPARVVGLGGETGAIRPGLAADLVVLDANLRLTAVMARGQWVEGVRPPR